MAHETIYDIDPYQPPAGAQWLHPDMHEASVGSEPGIIIHADGIDALTAAAHRPIDTINGTSLPEIDGPIQMDVTKLVRGVRSDVVDDLRSERLIGSEGEVYVKDRENGETIAVDEIGANEIHTSMIEANGEPYALPARAVRSLLERLHGFNRELLNRGLGHAAIDPASTLGDRPTTMQDVRRDDPYMDSSARRRPEYALFNGAGIHFHLEVPSQHSVHVASMLRMIIQYLNLPLHAAPFVDGREIPELPGHEAVDSVSSTRYLARAAFLDYGGVGIKAVDLNREAALRRAEERLIRAESNHISRLYGNHADIRIRFDVPDGGSPATPIRIEVCGFDTGVYREETVTAVLELLRAVTDRLVEYSETGPERLHLDYPELFTRTSDSDQLADALHTAEANAVQMAYDGFNAEIIDGTGARSSALIQLLRLCEFAAPRGAPLSNSTRRSLDASMSPKTHTARMIKLVTQDEEPTLRWYYLTGIGTPSDWMRENFAYHRAHGANVEEALRRGSVDRLASFDQYLRSKFD